MRLSLHERNHVKTGRKSDNTGRESNTVVPLQTALQIKIRWFNFCGHFKRLFRFKNNLKFKYVQIFFENDNELVGVMRKNTDLMGSVNSEFWKWKVNFKLFGKRKYIS
jgi:hypothetical protein